MRQILTIIFTILLLANSFYAQDKVYLVEIDGEIDLGLAPYIRRAVAEAEKNDAKGIIFKINTFGGRVDAATQIKDAILDSKVETVAFIDKRAISAGSLIALSCKTIVMVPGASIGATTVVDQTGKKQSEKAQSYMRSEMRATAERYNRPTDIAEGMVDERVVVEGLVDSTQLITLTSEEAIEYGIADTIMVDYSEVLALKNWEDAETVSLTISAAEKVIKILNHPIVTSVLLMVIMVGMFTEIKTPGWGVPGTAAVIALILFFGSAYIVELASVIEIILFVAGVLLIILEIFVIPGFGIFGVAGILLMISSLFLGLISDFPTIDWNILSEALYQFAAAIVLTVIMIYILSKYLPRTTMFNKLILNTNIDSKSGYTTEESVKNLLGEVGIAITDLRPAGTIKINKKRIDATTSGDYIEKGTSVVVIDEEGSKVVVEPSQS